MYRFLWLPLTLDFTTKETELGEIRGPFADEQTEAQRREA